MDNLKAGLEVWGYAFEYAKTNAKLKYSQTPVLGVLSYTMFESPDMFNDNYVSPQFFIPYKKGTKELDFKKAVSIYARDYAETEAEAIVLYNKKVDEAISNMEKLYTTEMAKMKKAKINNP